MAKLITTERNGIKRLYDASTGIMYKLEMGSAGKDYIGKPADGCMLIVSSMHNSHVAHSLVLTGEEACNFWMQLTVLDWENADFRNWIFDAVEKLNADKN